MPLVNRVDDLRKRRWFKDLVREDTQNFLQDYATRKRILELQHDQREAEIEGRQGLWTILACVLSVAAVGYLIGLLRHWF